MSNKLGRHASSLVLAAFLLCPFALAQISKHLSSYTPFPELDFLIIIIADCLTVSPEVVADAICPPIFGSLDNPPQPAKLAAPRLEANLGQSDTRYPFLGRANGYFLFLSPTETAVDLRDAGGANQGVIRMRLEGLSTRSTAEGLDPAQHRLNYFIGADSAKWVSNVPVFNRVRYRQVYRGIDVVFYSDGERFEHDFVVAPGADTRQIRMRFDGVESLAVENDGRLLLRTGKAEVIWGKPNLYQERNGRRVPVEGSYTLSGPQTVGFTIGTYDRSQPLIVDPTISYLTYLGQSESSLAGKSFVDNGGNTFVTGATAAGTWPTTPGAVMPRGGFSPSNLFISKMNAGGNILIYSTYIGGVAGDFGAAVAVDDQGNAYVAGVTNSSDYPTTTGAFRTTVPPASPTNRDLANCVVTKLNANGSALVYSTFLYGSLKEGCTAIAVDRQGNAFVTGGTDSTDFPTTEGVFQPTYRLGTETQKYDVFVTKLNPTGTGLVYSTYLGGGGNEFGSDIAIDAQGNAYITGSTTSSSNFPLTTGAADTTYGGHGGNDHIVRVGDAFAAKINATGTQLVYSTYIGGNRDDVGLGIAVDAQGAAYVAGNTLSPDFTTTANAYSRAYKGHGGEPLFNSGDAFVVKVNPDGRAFGYSTLLGGSRDDRAMHIAVDARGNAIVAGHTLSIDFPVTADAAQTANRNRPNVTDRLKLGNGFLAQLDADGSRLVYSTFVGGTNQDWLNSVSVQPDGTITVTGTTSSSDLATTPGAYQRGAFGGLDRQRPLGDVFIARFGDQAQPAVAGLVNAASYAANAAPGMIAVIAGTNIGPEVLVTAQLDSAGRVSTQLSETQVLVNNRPAPLVYVSRGQTSFIVPYETASGTNAQVVVVYRGVRSAPFSVPVVQANPGLFSANSSGTGQGAILNENNSFNSAQNPADKGSVIVFFLTGEGQTDPPGTDGQVASASFPKPALPVRVEMGGIQAEILYAGAAPGQVAGLMQVNARIPANSNSGPIPIIVTIGTAQSQRNLSAAVR